MLKGQLSSLTDSQQRSLLERLLSEKAQNNSRFPMSAGQQGLWHAFRRNPESTAFNVFLPTRIRGPLCPESLQQSINLVARRHSALRTTFSDSGGILVQTVHDLLRPGFECHQSLGVSEEQVRMQVLQEVLRPFCLETGPLLRIVAYQMAITDWVVLAVTHHIIVDFWSLIVILSELQAAYSAIASGRPPQLMKASDNYREFVAEQKAMLSSGVGSRMAEHWQAVLKEVPPVLELPTDFPRPLAFSNRAGSLPISISADTSRRIAQLASEHRSTPFAVVHAALQVLLSRYSRQSSFFIGSPFSGRTNQKFEQTVGFFINMLPIAVNVEPQQSFGDLIQNTSMRLLETLDNENTPIAEIVQSASLPRDPSRSPLFQVSCTFERSQMREELGRAGLLFPDQSKVFEFAGMTQESFYIPHPTCHYDLEFVFEQSDQGISGMLIYCSDLFQASSMHQLVMNFSSLLDSLLQHASIPVSEVPWSKHRHLPNLAEFGSQRSIQSLSTPTQHNTQHTVNDLICQSVVTAPNQIALQWSNQTVTYSDLLDVARNLAAHLAEYKVAADRLVPVLCRNGPHAFAAMLAVHLAGGAAVPVDLNQPSVRIDQAIEDTRSHCYLTDSKEELVGSGDSTGCLIVDFARPSLPANTSDQTQQSGSNLTRSTQLAYMIYTSGSTGQPKGVLVEHGSICNTLAWRARVLPLARHDRILMLLSHQFDACLGIGWSALTQAATLVWPDPNTTRDPTFLLNQIRRDQITILPVVPSFLRVLVQHPLFGKCTSLRSIWTGGEALPSDLPHLIRSKLPVRVWNLYGPTEAAVEATAADVTERPAHSNMTIGSPIDGMQVSILDSYGKPNPMCVPGQIAIAGPGLARGYFEDAQLTARRFVPHPSVPSSRAYLTGDLGRLMPDGSLEFLGRLDHQVKLRGFRIELGEIEAVLQSHPLVDRAAVVLTPANTSNPQLVAYVSSVPDQFQDSNIVPMLDQSRTCSGNCRFRLDELNEFLSTRLAHYKIPSAIIVLDKLPLTTSGKVDRKRLPDPKLNLDCEQLPVPSRNELEQWLATLWCQELALESVGIHQNFFEVGGSSLQAAMVTTRMSTDLEVHVPTALLFDLASIAQVARRLVDLYPQSIIARFGREVVDFYSSSQSSPANTPKNQVHSLLASLKPGGSLPPLFMVHPPGGIVLCYRELARHLPAEQPLWAVRCRGLHGQEALPNSMSEMAADYLEAIRSIQPRGPYRLGGWSLGGLVAYEIARQLVRDGQSIHRLVFLDTTIPKGATDLVPAQEQVSEGLEYGIDLTLEQLGDLSAEDQLPMLYEHAAKLGLLTRQSAPEVVQRVLHDLQYLFQHHVRLCRSYRLEPVPVNMLLLRPLEMPFSIKVTEDRGWRHLVSDVKVQFVSGHHHSMVQPPHAQHLAQIIAKEIN